MIRFIRKKEAAERVGYHPVHIMRLVKVGKFPRPVRLGPGALAFVESEIEEWLQQRIAERDAKRDAEPAEG